ncbi:hypothetical protein Ancab_019983 [Ancistrocladus abbreviatus]
MVTEEFFKEIAMRWGSFLFVDRDTRQKTRFDMARIVEVINTMLWVKVDEEAFPIRVAEEPFKIKDWSVENWEDNDGLCASPSSPSTSISAVPDLFGNIFAGEQQSVVVTSLKVVVDFLNFKQEKNVLDNPTPIKSRPTDGIELVKGRKDDPF